MQFLYTMASAPMTRQGMRDIAAEAVDAGVGVLQARKVPLHGKMLLWTPDDLVLTSHNWGSASTDVAFPMAEVGVAVRVPGLADAVLARLTEIYPGLDCVRHEVRRAETNDFPGVVRTARGHLSRGLIP